MKRIIFILIVISFAHFSYANDCINKALYRASLGDIDQLMEQWTPAIKPATEKKDDQAQANFRKIFKATGTLTSLLEIPTTRTTVFTRFSVAHSQNPSDFSYRGQWFAAKSDSLGDFEINVAGDGACKIYAVTFDFPTNKAAALTAALK